MITIETAVDEKIARTIKELEDKISTQKKYVDYINQHVEDFQGKNKILVRQNQDMANENSRLASENKDLDTKLKEQTKLCTSLQNECFSLSDDIKVKGKKIAQNEEEIAELKARNDLLQNKVLKMEDLQKNNNILVQQNQNAENENGRLISENKLLDQKLKEQSELCASLQNECFSLSDDVKKKDEEISQNKEEITELKEQVAQCKGEIAKLNEQIAQSQEKLSASKDQIVLLQKMVSNMENSHSWRITKPLRAVMRWLRRLFGHSKS